MYANEAKRLQTKFKRSSPVQEGIRPKQISTFRNKKEKFNLIKARSEGPIQINNIRLTCLVEKRIAKKRESSKMNQDYEKEKFRKNSI